MADGTTLEALSAEIRGLTAGQSRVEVALEAAVSRLESLIRSEIILLKNEHLARIERDFERLADDQRRSWDAIRLLERRDAERTGGNKTWHAVVAGTIGLVAAVLGGVAEKIWR